MYRKALDEGLYNSLRRLAEGLGVDVSLVSKSVSLARLPEAVVAAFPSPLDIQFRWAAPLAEALQKDPEGTLNRAKGIASEGRALGAAAVFNRLVKAEETTPSAVEPGVAQILRAGKPAGTVVTDGKGRVVVRLKAGVLPAARQKQFVELLEKFLKG